VGKLYIIPTPVGNLEDITLRAIRLLSEVDLILAEDTRTSRVLLDHFSIKTPVQAYHLYNEHQKVASVVNKLTNSVTMALISDAGTPAISDPGFLLVRECIRQGIEVECLPGATAFTPALVDSGLSCERFCFEGFLPTKKGRQTRLNSIAKEERTTILYESPFRVIKTLTQLSEVCGDERNASVSREISKKFEHTQRGTLRELIHYFTENAPKGEFVIILSGAKE
jgi:16S rRNA (cytidine1402-2'-O)-methyltransferase